MADLASFDIIFFKAGKQHNEPWLIMLFSRFKKIISRTF
jgi:hypothetical protein